MSNLVNKVKEVFHSSQDTPSDERKGKLNLSAEERERLETAGYGTSNHAEKHHLGAIENVALSASGHPPLHYLGNNTNSSSTLPDTFPGSETETLSTHHSDGREYVSPRGTHVGSTRAVHQPAQDRGGLTQPSEQRIASTVHDTTASDNLLHHSVRPMATAASTGVPVAKDTKTGPNKLHKKQDPRGHVVFNEPPSHGAIHGSQINASATDDEAATATHHSLDGGHQHAATTRTTDVYEQQATRKYDDKDNTGPNSTPNYSYPSRTAAATSTVAAGAAGLAASQIAQPESHQEPIAATSNTLSRQNPPRGVGIYNTVTGAGSHDDPTHGHECPTLGGFGGNPTFQSHADLATGSQAIPREAGDPSITGGHGNTVTSSNAPLPTTLTAAGLQSSTSASRHESNPGATYSTGAAATYGTTTYSPTRHTSAAGSSTMGSGQDHHGPGYAGSKVLHKCTKCGEDNDISHYFKKDTVYRLSQ